MLHNVSSMWMQNPKCCTLSSVCFRCFNDSVTAINVTVAATEKGPELRILSRPLGCKAPMGCSGALQVWGQGSGGSSRAPQPVSPVPRFLGPVLMEHSHTKSRKSGNRATRAFGEHYIQWERPENESNLRSRSLILVNYNGEKGSQIFIF